MNKKRVEFIDSSGTKQGRWIKKEEWDFLINFRHKKAALFHTFGSRVIGLGSPPTEEEYEAFEKWYIETYPERCNIKTKNNNNE